MGLIKYLQETQAELKFVKWPTQRQTIVYTALVIIISIVTAVYLGVFDAFFTSGLQKVTEQNTQNIAPYTFNVEDITTTSASTSTATTTNNN